MLLLSLLIVMLSMVVLGSIECVLAASRGGGLGGLCGVRDGLRRFEMKMFLLLRFSGTFFCRFVAKKKGTEWR